VRLLSEIEETFAVQLRCLPEIPAATREHTFLKDRKFRFDFAWPSCKMAVEIDGGTATGGRHVRPQGYEKDCEKLALAILDGWVVFKFTSKQVKNGFAYNSVEKYFKKTGC